MVYSINYFSAGAKGDGEVYRAARDNNTRTAYSHGKVDKVLQYEESDIEEFIGAHREIFKIARGAGLWLWKPYIILKTLERIEEGDYVFYADSGSTYIDRVDHLIRIMERDQTWIMPFELPLIARQFTKRETFVRLGADTYDQNQVLATCILIRKCDESIRFVNEWLSYCTDLELLSPEHFHSDIQEWPDFFAHREDQSIFDICVRKYKLKVYREPSDGGEMPWYYIRFGFQYNEKKYPDSDYPTILLNNRQTDCQQYMRQYRRRKLMKSIGLNNAFLHIALRETKKRLKHCLIACNPFSKSH